MIRDAQNLLERLRVIHAAIRDRVVAECEQSAIEQLAHVVAEEGGDTIFAIDRISEHVLLDLFAELGHSWSFVLIAEGLGEDGRAVFPAGSDPAQAELRIIVDPIDGTRGLMYQKRPAWILTGVAPNRGADTRLSAIELAIQTEIPLVKQHLSDSLWALADEEPGGERFNRLSGERYPLHPKPSQAKSIAQGYGNIARFFPGTRAELASIDDEIVLQALGPVQMGKAQAFEDQYISSGGQLYELMMGHDRWVADLRPLVATTGNTGLCCHPYDLCTELIARKAGIIVTDEHEQPLNAPLDVNSPMAWMGYANRAIYEQIAPLLHRELERRNML